MGRTVIDTLLKGYETKTTQFVGTGLFLSGILLGQFIPEAYWIIAFFLPVDMFFAYQEGKEVKEPWHE